MFSQHYYDTSSEAVPQKISLMPPSAKRRKLGTGTYNAGGTQTTLITKIFGKSPAEAEMAADIQAVSEMAADIQAVSESKQKNTNTNTHSNTNTNSSKATNLSEIT